MHIILVAHDIRSAHNVGAFFRTCDGLGITEILFSGYTPYPSFEGDTRMPHFADKITRQIHKTALGAESTVPFTVYADLSDTLAQLKKQKAVIIALEQHPSSLSPFACRDIVRSKFINRPVAIIVGNEIHGVSDDVLKQVDLIMEIKMHGLKESLNVSVATAIALYSLTSS